MEEYKMTINIDKLREQVKDTYIKMMDLLDTCEKANIDITFKNVLDQNLRDLMVDEDFIMLRQSEEILREVDQRVFDEFNLNIKRSNKQALVIVMMDNSGSMGIWEKYVSRCVIERLERLFQYKYPNVEFKFIHHHTVAEEVEREDFFVKGETGGTICSSAYRKANELIEQFDYIENDVYLLHVSDGDNLTSDVDRTVGLIKKLLLKCKFVGYLEINQYNRHSTLLKGAGSSKGLKYIFDDKFYYHVLYEKDGVYEAVSDFAYQMLEE
jgi:hypothetical protein